MATRKPTLQDIAKKLSISTASVSRALADNPRISRQLRQKVQDTAREIGYVPNSAARALRSSKPDVAALMVPNLGVLKMEGALDILQAIDHELGVHGLRLQIASYHQVPLVAATTRKLMSDPRMAGLLFLTDYVTEQLIEIVGSSPIPTVLVNAYPERNWEKWEGIYCSGTENLVGSELATRHLLANGHTRIAALVCDPGQRDADLREEGYHYAMKDAGVKVRPEYVVRCDFLRGFETGRAAIHRLIAATGEKRPTALFCSSDSIAAGAMRGLAEVGLKVPQDMAVVGFGNQEFSNALQHTLTTVTHDGAAVGRGAARLFLHLVFEEGEPPSPMIQQPAELLVRESSMVRRPSPNSSTTASIVKSS